MVSRALDFPLGHPIIPAARVRRRRDLPPDARPRVQIGEQVRADLPIADTSALSGTSGLLAGLAGAVADVGPSYVTIEGIATILQGPAGIGNSVAGPLALVSATESPAVVPIARGAILVYSQRLPLTLLQRAAAGGAVGVIAASAAALELEAFARTDLSALLDGMETDMSRVPLTVLLTEGFGDAPMQAAVQGLLASRAGTLALLSGVTDPRQNVRAEALLTPPPSAQPIRLPADSRLVEGARVRVTAGHFRGTEGILAHLFAFPQPSETGHLLPSAELQLERGGICVVPLALLDRLA
jgi:hypothetical protein